MTENVCFCGRAAMMNHPPLGSRAAVTHTCECGCIWEIKRLAAGTGAPVLRLTRSGAERLPVQVGGETHFIEPFTAAEPQP